MRDPVPGHCLDVDAVEQVRVPVSGTTPAKTVADCFRYRRYVGMEVALGSLRGYLRKHPKGIDALTEAAKADRVYSVLRPYLEALA